MRGSCCLRCIHLLFLLIFLLSISTLSINLYLSTFYQFISTRLIFIILCLNFSNFSNFSVTYQLSANLSLSLCQLLWRLGACLSWLRRMLRHFDISTFRHFAIDSRSSTLVSKCLCSPREGRPNAENSPPSCRSRGNVKNLSSRTSKV